MSLKTLKILILKQVIRKKLKLITYWHAHKA